MHGLEAHARQVLIALAAGIAPHANAPQEHAGLHNYQSPLAVRELGVAQLADAASLTVQPLGMGLACAGANPDVTREPNSVALKPVKGANAGGSAASGSCSRATINFACEDLDNCRAAVRICWKSSVTIGTPSIDSDYNTVGPLPHLPQRRSIATAPLDVLLLQCRQSVQQTDL